MNVSRRNFLEGLGAAGALSAFAGCKGWQDTGWNPLVKGKIAVQLYSIHQYIGGRKDKDGNVILPGRGLANALQDVAKLGYRAVEFAGYYDNDAPTLKAMLADAGLVACGSHVSNGQYGFNTKDWTFDEEKMKATCAFNLAYGNSLIICPGGGNIPPGCSWSTGQGGDPCTPTKEIDEFTKKLADLYNRGAEVAAKEGCRIGLHNHTWEHAIKMTDGTSFWDFFFSNTSKNVMMEQDIGWSTCAGVDPSEQWKKYPGRSPTLHAKENGMGKNVKEFDAILGMPGKPDATPVDWKKALVNAELDGIEWWVVECERHFNDLSAITPSYAFLKTLGLN